MIWCWKKGKWDIIDFEKICFLNTPERWCVKNAGGSLVDCRQWKNQLCAWMSMFPTHCSSGRIELICCFWSSVGGRFFGASEKAEMNAQGIYQAHFSPLCVYVSFSIKTSVLGCCVKLICWISFIANTKAHLVLFTSLSCPSLAALEQSTQQGNMELLCLTLGSCFSEMRWKRWQVRWKRGPAHEPVPFLLQTKQRSWTCRRRRSCTFFWILIFFLMLFNGSLVFPNYCSTCSTVWGWDISHSGGWTVPQ